MPNGVPKRKVTRLIEKTEVQIDGDALRRAWQNSPGRDLQLIPVDRVYWGVPWKTWELILRYTAVDAGQYRSDRYDCDDFAFALRAAVSRKLALNSVGLVIDYSGRHAYSALLVTNPGEEPKVVFLEPQNDRLIIKYEGMYSADVGFAIY